MNKNFKTLFLTGLITLATYFSGRPDQCWLLTTSAESSNYKEINILDLGADPSGKVNCSQILQKAIDSANGGVVYIPAGLFLLENTISISGKDKFKLRCEGQIYLNLNQEAFRIVNSSWCSLEGLSFISKDSAGVGIKIMGNSRFNVFENILAHGLNNYLFEIDNGFSSDIPNGNIIKDIDTRYSKGLLKDIADDNALHGKEISVYNVRGATRLDNYDDEEKVPAYIWCKNIHDIFLSNIEGEHKYSYVLLQGDCNAILNNLMASSYEKSTVIFSSTANAKINLINFNNSYMWGVPSTHPYYKPNFAMEVSGCYVLNASNIIISNYDRAGICQKSDGNFFYSDLRFVNNVRDIEFYSLNPETTILNFNNIFAVHSQKGESIFFAADSVNLGAIHIECINSTFSIKNRKQNSTCKVFDLNGVVIDSSNCRIFR